MEDKTPTSGYGDNELYIPLTRFENLTNIHRRNLVQLGCRYQGSGVPLLQLVSLLFNQYMHTKTTLRASGVDEDIHKIKILQEHEKLTYFQIRNQQQLGQLVEKDIAKARMISALSSYQMILMTAVKNLASHKFSEDIRKNEEFITNHFNGLVDRILEDIAEIKEWEEDGSVRLLTTKVLKSKEETSLEDEMEIRDWEEELEDD